MRRAGSLLVLAAWALAACSDQAGAPAAGGAAGVEQGGTGLAGAGGAQAGGSETSGSASGGVSGHLAVGGAAGMPPQPTAGAGAGGSAAGGSGGSAGAPSVSPRVLGDLYCPTTEEPYPAPLAGSPQATLVPIAPPGGISFLEGPVWLAERGVLLMSEWMSGHRILQLTPPQTIEVFLPSSGTNGLLVHPSGDALLMITEQPNGGVSRLSLLTKNVEALVSDYQGQSFVQPNDLAVRLDGTLFFTDYQAGRLYRRKGDAPITLVASQPHANGVAISPDEQTLYLNSDARVLAYPLGDDSALGQPTDLVTGVDGADGLAIDCAGNVYIAQNEASALLVVSAQGEPLGQLTMLADTVTNAAFGGPERKTLYITTASALYSVALPIPGLPY